jgi:hypothetical protein
MSKIPSGTESARPLMGHARHIGRAPVTSTIAPIATESPVGVGQ